MTARDPSAQRRQRRARGGLGGDAYLGHPVGGAGMGVGGGSMGMQGAHQSQDRYYTDQHAMRRTQALGQAVARRQHHAAYGDHYSRLGDAHDMVGATYLGDRTWVGPHGRHGGRYPSRADPRF